MTDALHAGLRVQTDDGLVSWQELWAAFEPRLRRLLRRRAGSHDVDDLLQDVVERMIATDTEVDSVNGFERWCTKVATNRLSDVRKKHARMIAGVPDVVDVIDVADHAVHKLEAEKVLGQVALLSDADRHALANDGVGLTRAAQNKLNVQRHRARMRLAKLLAGVAGVLGLRRPAKLLLLPALALVAVFATLPLVGVRPDASGPGVQPIEPIASVPSTILAGSSSAPGSSGGGPSTPSTKAALPPASTAGRPMVGAASGAGEKATVIGVPTASVGGPVPVGIRQAPSSETPTDENGNRAAYCYQHGSEPEQCIYYPVNPGLHYSFDPEDPLATLPDALR